MTDTEIRVEGLKILTAAMGEVQAERFISLMLREPFDYTVWQREQLKGLTVDELSKLAMAHRKAD